MCTKVLIYQADVCSACLHIQAPRCQGLDWQLTPSIGKVQRGPFLFLCAVQQAPACLSKLFGVALLKLDALPIA